MLGAPNKKELHLVVSDRKGPKPAKPRIRQVPAVSRALAILRLLGTASDPVSLKTIADQLSLVASTCLHILRVLVAENLVKVDVDTKRYTLGSGMLSLARNVIERSGFANLAQPGLDRLSQTWKITTMGVEVQNNDHVIVLAISRSDLPFKLHTDVGSRFPSLASATGRLVAAFGGQTWPALEKRFKSLQWSRPIDFATWKTEIEQSRKRGFSIDRGRYIAGITILSVPLLNSAGRITHTLVGAGLSEQMNAGRVSSIVDDMRQEAGRLSALVVPR